MISEAEKRQAEEVTKSLTYFFKGNMAAVQYCLDLWKIAHVWDDIIDNGAPLQREVNDIFRIALVEIPLNPFFDAYRNHLLPLMMNTILCWEDSNVLDHGSEHDQHMSYMLRAAAIQIMAYCAYLIGGPEWSRQVGPDIRRLMIEELPTYMEEMKNANG